MSEFTPITTQEQFDAAIGERLKRERESLAKKYGDYDALKQKTDDYERQIAEYSKSLEAAKQAASAHDQVVTELNAKLKGYESASVKTRIATNLASLMSWPADCPVRTKTPSARMQKHSLS